MRVAFDYKCYSAPGRSKYVAKSSLIVCVNIKVLTSDVLRIIVCGPKLAPKVNNRLKEPAK